jgi:multiple sugar transport system substrate-binding protein
MTRLQPIPRTLPCALAISTLLASSLPVVAADLRIFWDQGFYPEEDAAIQAVVAAYQRESGKDVELTFYSQDEVSDKTLAALNAGGPPDLALAFGVSSYVPKWALDGMLADLSDVVTPIRQQFYPGVLDSARLRNGQTGETAYYAIPIGQFGHYIHVWKSLLDQAGIGVDQIPHEWDAFWAFWCDTVQPAVREATGRDDIYGIGLPMSADASDTVTGLSQFRDAYGIAYLSPDGTLTLDAPAVHAKTVQILADYTVVWRKGCTPPDSTAWTNIDNNKAFHDQRVVMTINSTLSITNALQAKRPDDYYRNTVTIAWPNGPDGKPFAIETGFISVVVFKDAKNVEGAKDFLRYLLSDARLGAYLEASLGRGLPAMPALLDTPFWQDAKDPHRTTAVAQLGQPVAASYPNLNPKYGQVDEEAVWEKAVHRIAADGVSPEQAADEAIARIKQMLAN